MQTISQKNSKTIMKNDSHLEILYSQMKRANAKTFLVPNFYFWTFLSTKIDGGQKLLLPKCPTPQGAKNINF